MCGLGRDMLAWSGLLRVGRRGWRHVVLGTVGVGRGRRRVGMVLEASLGELGEGYWLLGVSDGRRYVHRCLRRCSLPAGRVHVAHCDVELVLERLDVVLNLLLEGLDGAGQRILRGLYLRCQSSGSSAHRPPGTTQRRDPTQWYASQEDPQVFQLGQIGFHASFRAL